MDHNEREKLIFDLIDHGQWDKAIEHAKVIPDHHDIWQRLPSVNNERHEGMPNSAIHKVLDHLGDNLHNSGFLFEMANNLYDTHDRDTLSRLAHAANKQNTHFEIDKFTKHPNYKESPEEQRLAYANVFWNDYERNVKPHHFAVIKSLYSGQPETIKHRGEEGVSTHHGDVLPHLHDYAAKVQEKILADDNIHKRYYNGEPYIRVHRGIGGHYSKMIRDAAKYNTKTGEYDHKYLTVPVAPFSSWTTDHEMAQSFAKGRGADLDMKGHGLIMTKWMPVKDILHSGAHNVLPGRTGVHPSEQEIVVGHPTGRMKMSTGELHFENKQENTEDPDTKYYGSTFDKGKKREKVSKGLKDAALHLGIATAMMGMPQHLADQHHDQIITPQSQEQNVVKPLPGLKYIEMIESSGGKNTDHQMVRRGLNAGTKAIGRYGIMPLQAIETVSKDKGLAAKYPDFLKYHYLNDADKISEQITKNPNLENDIANSHWKRLYDRFDGDENRMAHAWLNGVTGTLEADPDAIASHDYVKKYQRYKRMMQLEHDHRQPAGLQKSESKLPPEVKQIKGFEAFDNHTPDTQLKNKAINDLIQNQAFHAVPGMGHFTHSSFVLGTNHDNSWLIKVEAGNRPGIMSAKSGLQSVKESAFYDVAKEYFGLGELLPEVILGEVIYENDRKPAAAIKMLPSEFKLAVEQEEAQPGSMVNVLDKYRKSGLMHKAALMLYVLGDGDSHGRNVMTDGYFVRLIDHGSGFANADFNPSTDSNIFIPYILRVGHVKDNMTPDQKVEAMPKIENKQVKENLSAWILSLNSRNLAQKLNNDGIDPIPTEGRLKKLQSMVAEGIEPDHAINTVWVRG